MWGALRRTIENLLRVHYGRSHTKFLTVPDRVMDAPPVDRQEDMAAELKHLPRENEVLSEEHAILKRATAFS